MLLLPEAIQDWLPDGHLAHFISDTVDIRVAEVFVAPELSGDGGFIFLPALHELRAQADWARHDLAAAEAHFRRALTRATELFGARDLETLGLQARLAGFLAATDREEEADRLLNEVEGGLTPAAVDDRRKFRYLALIRLGHAQAVAGRYLAASGNLARALGMRSGMDASPALAQVWRDQARALTGLRQHAAAREALAHAVAMRERAGLHPPDVLREEARLRDHLNVAK